MPADPEDPRTSVQARRRWLGRRAGALLHPGRRCSPSRLHRTGLDAFQQVQHADAERVGKVGKLLHRGVDLAALDALVLLHPGRFRNLLDGQPGAHTSRGQVVGEAGVVLAHRSHRENQPSRKVSEAIFQCPLTSSNGQATVAVLTVALSPKMSTSVTVAPS
jgi:hypothetical protein